MKLFAHCLFVLCLTSCATQPGEILIAQKEIVATVESMSETVDEIKIITDIAKTTGEIPKPSVQTVIKYVDKISEDTKTLKTLVNKQTEDIANYDSIVESLKKDVEKYKPYKWRFIIYLGLTIAGAGIVLIWKLKSFFISI